MDEATVDNVMVAVQQAVGVLDGRMEGEVGAVVVTVLTVNDDGSNTWWVVASKATDLDAPLDRIVGVAGETCVERAALGDIVGSA